MFCIKIIYGKGEKMNNFKSYANSKNKGSERMSKENFSDSKAINGSAFEMLKKLAFKYEGASEQELVDAIVSEANKLKKSGMLSPSEINNFVSTISPMLNAEQKRLLKKVVEKISN